MSDYYEVEYTIMDSHGKPEKVKKKIAKKDLIDSNGRRIGITKIVTPTEKPMGHVKKIKSDKWTKIIEKNKPPKPPK